MTARSPVLLGVSLKMYFDPAETLVWARAVADLASRHPALRDGAARLFVLPALPSVPAAIGALTGTGVAVGAQDLHWQDRGPATGGVSGADLVQLGCVYAEVNHAERRTVFGEDEAVAAAKLRAALRNGLVPVVCVGERWTVGADQAVATCTAQLDRLLGDHDAVAPRVVVAYEPEWAIGAETSASPAHVRAVAAGIRAWLAAHPAVADSAVLYGGSAGPGLLPELGDAVDGLFLGRFAHDPAALERVLDETMEHAGG